MASQIDPNVPAQDAALDSAPIRANFEHIKSEIEERLPLSGGAMEPLASGVGPRLSLSNNTGTANSRALEITNGAGSRQARGLDVINNGEGTGVRITTSSGTALAVTTSSNTDPAVHITTGGVAVGLLLEQFGQGTSFMFFSRQGGATNMAFNVQRLNPSTGQADLMFAVRFDGTLVLSPAGLADLKTQLGI